MTTPAPVAFRLGLQLRLFLFAPVQIEVDLAFKGKQFLDLLFPKKLRDRQVDGLGHQGSWWCASDTPPRYASNICLPAMMVKAFE